LKYFITFIKIIPAGFSNSGGWRAGFSKNPAGPAAPTRLNRVFH
jgi:hypothetical protein